MWIVRGVLKTTGRLRLGAEPTGVLQLKGRQMAEEPNAVDILTEATSPETMPEIMAKLVAEKKKQCGAKAEIAPRRLIGFKSLQRKMDDCSRNTIYRRVEDGTLPPPIYIGDKPYWDEPAVDARFDELFAEANAGEAA